jgi:hypothetical protein
MLFFFSAPLSSRFQGPYKAGRPATHKGRIVYAPCRTPVWPPTAWDGSLALRSARLPKARRPARTWAQGAVAKGGACALGDPPLPALAACAAAADQPSSSSRPPHTAPPPPLPPPSRQAGLDLEWVYGYEGRAGAGPNAFYNEDVGPNWGLCGGWGCGSVGGRQAVATACPAASSHPRAKARGLKTTLHHPWTCGPPSPPYLQPPGPCRVPGVVAGRRVRPRHPQPGVLQGEGCFALGRRQSASPGP